MGIHVPYLPPPTRAITNGHSSGTPAGVEFNANQVAKAVASGALTATTLATALTITGAGYAPIIALSQTDATSRTLRLQVIVDGTTVFDSTSAASTTANRGIIAAGSAQRTSGSDYVLLDGVGVRFNASLVVKIASSVTETDKLTLHYAAYTE